MTAEIERRLEAAGVRVLPLIWYDTGRESMATRVGGYEIERYDKDQFVLRTPNSREYYERVPFAKAAAEAHHRASVLAQLGGVE